MASRNQDCVGRPQTLDSISVAALQNSISLNPRISDKQILDKIKEEGTLSYEYFIINLNVDAEKIKYIYPIVRQGDICFNLGC
jgi:hypothetical protein